VPWTGADPGCSFWRMRRGIGLAAAAAVACLAATAPAQADFHLMKVSEVSVGSGSEQSFVELQMIAAGQSVVQGHTLTVRDQAGTVVGTYDFPSSVANGDNQRTILIADTNGPTDADFTWPGLDLGQQLAAGAVCFDQGLPPDCVAWGGFGFTGTNTLPSPTTPYSVGLPLPAGNGPRSLTRSMSAGCNTLLESSDDTDSAADFSESASSPRPNSIAPTESSCPATQITKKPKPKTLDRTPTFEFSGGDTYLCKLDSADFTACSNPFAPGRLSRGKHEIKVRAVENDGSIDGTPESYSWRIVRRR
jgi:hypothetical protein